MIHELHNQTGIKLKRPTRKNKLPSLSRTKKVTLTAFTQARYILNITHLERSLEGPRETHH